MTTTVKTSACCSPEKEVHVFVMDDGEQTEFHVLQNGESLDCYAYDGREIVVREVVKGSQA